MIRTYLKSITVVVLVFIIFLPAPPVYGQTRGQRQAEGIDLILMIDESGSMGGHGKHPLPNDPYHKRNELLFVMLPYIVESAYRGNIFRISIVEFGSRKGSGDRWRPQVTLSRYKIEKPKTGESQVDYKDRVSRELAYLRGDRFRGDSDHGGAMEKVLEEIKQMQKIPVSPPMGQIGTANREIVIFLLTDGMPYVKGVDTPQLKEEIQETVKRFPPQDAIFYAFGLNDADDYWNRGYGRFWDLIASTTSDNRKNRGEAQGIGDHKRFLEQVLPILSKYIIPPGLEIIYGDKFDCPPYLKSIEFIVEFPRSYMKISQAVDIFKPDGSKLNTSNAREKQVNAYIDVHHPVGGIWRFQRKDKDVKLMVRKTYENVTFLAPGSPVYMSSTHNIKFKASGPGPNNTFVVLSQFPLQSRIIVRTPQGAEDILNAELDPKNPGVFTSKTPYQFQRRGEYQVEFEASGTSGAGSPLVVLSSTAQKVQVSDSTPVVMVMEEPGGKVHSSFATLKQDFAFGFYSHDKKKKFPLQDILQANEPIEATAEVLGVSSDLLIKKADFRLDGKNDSLVGPLKINLSLMEIFKILAGKRKVKITLQLDQRHIKDGYFLAVPQTQTRLYEFDREVKEGLLIYLLIVLLILLVVGLIVWLLWIFSRHECSKDVPVLIYRQESELTEDDGYNRSIMVDKPKIYYKHGDIAFNVPESTALWKPELTIKRNCIDEGVSVTVEYEKYGNTHNHKKSLLRSIMETLKIKQRDPERENTRKFTMQTRFAGITSKHPIPELKDAGMIFELKIKGKEGY